MQNKFPDDRKSLEDKFGIDVFKQPRIPIGFPDLLTVASFWKQNPTGVFLLYTAGRHQPADSANLFLTLLVNGVLKSSSSTLLKRQLVAVEKFTESIKIIFKANKKGQV